MHRRPARAIIALTLVAAVAGCEAADAPDGTPAEDDRALAAGTVEFAPVNRSGVTGTARFEEDDDDVTVTIELVGLETGTVYPTHLYNGRCAAGGNVVAALGDITGGEDGRGRLMTDVEAADLASDEPLFVQAEGSGGNALACADVGGEEDPGASPTDRLEADSAAADRAGSV
ncbi:MAG TPA: hypothetical protein VMM83_00390 [Longimicrobiales bacterium]|nr:hypothetical protein [Longimicrobiales bacterium]